MNWFVSGLIIAALAVPLLYVRWRDSNLTRPQGVRHVGLLLIPPTLAADALNRAYPRSSEVRPIDELLPPIHAYALQKRFRTIDLTAVRAAVSDVLIQHFGRLLSGCDGREVVTYDRLSGFGSSRYALANLLRERLDLGIRDRLPMETVFLAEFSIDIMLRSGGHVVLWTYEGACFEIEQCEKRELSENSSTPQSRPTPFDWAETFSRQLFGSSYAHLSAREDARRLLSLLDRAALGRSQMSYVLRSAEPFDLTSIRRSSEWPKATFERHGSRNWLPSEESSPK